ncbi:MAG: hypothetical protein WDW38_011392 [Sanguina aurantia]
MPALCVPLAACTCATRSKHLLSRVQSLQDYALRCVTDGNDSEAKTTLQTKQTLRHTLDKNITRAEVNYALAAKLTSVLAMLQMEMSGLMAQDPSHSPPPDSTLPASSPAPLPPSSTTPSDTATTAAANNIVVFPLPPLDADTRHNLIPDYTTATQPHLVADAGTQSAIRQLVSTAVAQRYVLTDEQLESTLVLLQRQLKNRRAGSVLA